MTLQIKASGHEVPDKLRGYAERKVERLGRYFGDIERMVLSVVLEHGVYIAELTAEGDGTLLRSEERNGDLHAAINDVTDKVERQAVKYKSRVRDERRKAQPDKHADLLEPSSDEPGDDEPFVPVVARRKRYALKPMSVEEAARQMELVSHPFYLFRSDESGEICALYRRHDGNYGLIEPDV
ncbi:MAG: ribosome-associated translation inhibitor RaiA [Armatimonadetes bacterium]|nr:ribosome-associated translation inhibitor RaiA [Armatimonadota bacterium]